MKTDGHLGRCYLKGREGDAANVILSAVGHNFRLVLAWLRIFLEPNPAHAFQSVCRPTSAHESFLTADYLCR